MLLDSILMISLQFKTATADLVNGLRKVLSAHCRKGKSDTSRQVVESEEVEMSRSVPCRTLRKRDTQDSQICNIINVFRGISKTSVAVMQLDDLQGVPK